MTHPLIAHVESAYLKKKVPQFEVGDTVEVRCRVKEGDKERIQPFVGVVIMRKGRGATAMFTVRRLVQGEGVERTFPLHSPLIESVRVRRSGRVRRARLYYLRERLGKATRLKERIRQAEATAEDASSQTTQTTEATQQT